MEPPKECTQDSDCGDKGVCIGTVHACLRKAPKIRSVQPSSGSILGSTPITIEGDYLGADVSVTIGGKPLNNFNIGQDGRITGNTPPWDETSGSRIVDVVILYESNPVDMLKGSFTYTKPLAISAGGSHSLALLDDGTVWSWWDNSLGQLGKGSSGNSLDPVKVFGLTGVTAIAAGNSFSFALRSDGTVWGWGYNIFGGLSDGTTGNYRS